MDNLAKEKARHAADRGELRTVYKVTKQLCGNKSCSSYGQAARWVEPFREVLYRPDPDHPAIIEPYEVLLNIDTRPSSREEIRLAIKAKKNGKTCGVDNIQAEMLKADTETTSEILTDLFYSIWNSETIPKDWTSGLIVKFPKKGNLHSYDNWRGITLLSVPSKVFCRILLMRIDSAIDTNLREEQAGFRKEKVLHRPDIWL